MCECSLTTPERSIHSDVRGALGRCRGVRLQAPGSDAGVSQLPFLHGLKAGPGSNASFHVHRSATIKALKKKKKATGPRINLLGPLIAVLKEIILNTPFSIKVVFISVMPVYQR